MISENEMADYSITTVKSGEAGSYEIGNGGQSHRHPTSLGR